MFRGKNYKESAKLIDKTRLYEAGEAIDAVLSTAKAKFDETVELHVRLGVDPKQADQQVRGVLVLPNGTGKTSLLRLLMGEELEHTGLLRRGSGLVISYVPQRADHLSGLPADFARAQGVDRTQFFTILRKLDFSRALLERDMAGYSAGQKKKVLLAASLCQSAHLYIWDEPLNYIDLFSRIQLEELILQYRPTMVFVEHDRTFREHVATAAVELERWEIK